MVASEEGKKAEPEAKDPVAYEDDVIGGYRMIVPDPNRHVHLWMVLDEEVEFKRVRVLVASAIVGSSAGVKACLDKWKILIKARNEDNKEMARGKMEMAWTKEIAVGMSAVARQWH
ncbi:hypothetical protein HAX54_046113, partial [Datura stramonium]|nr:hypothetical protein [Datura stramonium]